MPSPVETDAPHQPDRSLDRKLQHIISGRYTPDDFVLADAKDADMGFGLTAAGLVDGAQPGSQGPGTYQSRDAYLEAMRTRIAGGGFDILLASASNGERLAAEGQLDRQITLAVRANDTTDIWLSRGAEYASLPSRPFRSADLSAIKPFCDLVLYSITLNNDLERDLSTLEAYRAFRLEASALGVRHFLEVFNPNAPVGLKADQIPAFVNDSIVRVLAGVTTAQRPLFLKVSYNGADALAELVEHDRSMVVGVLGGSPGTTRDTFELLHRIEANGGRIALFGRKIQHAESQPDLIDLMRPVLHGELSPSDAVRAYHDALRTAAITPQRTLEADLELSDPVLRTE